MSRSYAKAAGRPLHELERPGFVHNVIGHPLLWLCPRLGNWIHAHSEPVKPVRVVTVHRVPGGPWWNRMRWHYVAEWPAWFPIGEGGWAATWLGAQLAARLVRRGVGRADLTADDVEGLDLGSRGNR